MLCEPLPPQRWPKNALMQIFAQSQELDPHRKQEASPRVAAIISLVESCSRLNIPIRDYLGSVLPGLANRPISRIGELTPAAWANRNLWAKQ